MALSSDAHRPEQLGHEYERAVEWLSDLGVTELSRVRGPAAAAGADRVSASAGGPLRAGIGFDTHRLDAGRPLILGGVHVEDAPRGLAGHSDADVLTHAVIDALLGAAGLGDIGEHFPDTDERWRDADSLELLRAVVQQLADAGYSPPTSTQRSPARSQGSAPSATRCARAWPRRRASSQAR